MMGASDSNPAQNEGQHQDKTQVWRLRGLNLQADDSAPAAAQSHHALSKSLARSCYDRK